MQERTLEDRPFSSLEEVETYAEKTASSILYLTLEIFGKFMTKLHLSGNLNLVSSLISIFFLLFILIDIQLEVVEVK